jgi:hypothetical protein
MHWHADAMSKHPAWLHGRRLEMGGRKIDVEDRWRRREGMNVRLVDCFFPDPGNLEMLAQQLILGVALFHYSMGVALEDHRRKEV